MELDRINNNNLSDLHRTYFAHDSIPDVVRTVGEDKAEIMI